MHPARSVATSAGTVVGSGQPHTGPSMRSATSKLIEPSVLTLLEFNEFIANLVAMPAQRLSMFTSFGRFLCCQRCLRHHRPQGMVVGSIGDNRELFVDLSQFNAQLPETFGRLRQAAFQQPTSHRAMLRAVSPPRGTMPRRSHNMLRGYAVREWRPMVTSQRHHCAATTQHRVECPESDSNRHWTVFETAASAVGLPGHSVGREGPTTSVRLAVDTPRAPLAVRSHLLPPVGVYCRANARLHISRTGLSATRYGTSLGRP